MLIVGIKHVTHQKRKSMYVLIVHAVALLFLISVEAMIQVHASISTVTRIKLRNAKMGCVNVR